MRIAIVAVAALIVAMWLGSMAGHWMDRHVKAREIAIEEIAR